MIDQSYVTNRSGIEVSFEFFPPKTEQMDLKLWKAIKRLEPLEPRFVSVTYGAGGSTRERTHATVKRILQQTSLQPAAHLTCVDATKADVDDVIRSYWEEGVRHIVALRGDSVNGAGEAFRSNADGYQNGADLVAGIKKIADFEISVPAYPEKHPESSNFNTDIDMLKAKIDAGATRAITQFFFSNDDFRRYQDLLLTHGIYIPVVPGILPVQNFTQVVNFSKRCGAHIPAWLSDRFEGLEEDIETRRLIAASVVLEQVMDLMRDGVREFHFYTMNSANLVYAICHLLGIRPQTKSADKFAA